MAIRKIFSNSKTEEVSPEEFELEVSLWQRQFADIPFVEVFNAFEVYCADNIYKPMPAHLRQIIARNRNPKAFISAEEAWTKISALANKYGFDGQKEAYKELDDKTKQIIKAIGGWWDVCRHERPEIVKARFKANWELASEPERKQVQIPTNILRRLKSFESSGELSEPKQLPEV